MNNSFLLLLMNSMDVFFLIFARVMGIFLVAPFFSRMQVPSFVKVGLNMIISYSILPFLIYQSQMNYDFIELIFLFIKEFVLGLVIGYTAQMFFNIFISAGSLADIQMGLSMAQTVDPSTNIRMTNTGNLLTAFAYLIFFASNSHHLLIRGIVNSFALLPIGKGVFYTSNFLNYVIKLLLYVIETSLLIIMPIMIVLILGNILLAFMSKVMPQMNVFIVGMPFKIFVGFIVLVILIPHIKGLTVGIFMKISEYMYMLLRILSESV